MGQQVISTHDSLDVIESKVDHVYAGEDKNELKEAERATNAEHSLTIREGFRIYWKAVLWSLLISGTIVMEGYDRVFIGALYAEPTFRKRYGVPFEDGYQIPAKWQTGLSCALDVGNVIGIYIAGQLTERIGHKKMLLGGLVWLCGMIFINFFSTSLGMLCTGVILTSLSYGVFSITAVVYAAEICPTVLRGYMTTYVCLCFVTGQFVSAGVTYRCEKLTDKWSYKIPFAVQWAWPLPLMIGILFAPESPWWLVRRGRLDEAKRSLQRLSNVGNEQDTISLMLHTNHLEEELEAGTSYWDCFKGVDLRRTEIACATFIIQAICGSAITGQLTYFFEQAGISTDNSFKMGLGATGLAWVATASSWLLITYVGRRRIILGGCTLMCIVLLTMGFLSLAPKSNDAAKWATAAMVFCFNATYFPTTGATTFAIVGEVGSTRLRSKTVALARNAYTIINIVVGVFFPYMINPSAGDWKGKVGFFWAGSCILCIVWAYFRLPELKERTYEELDLMFANKVKARDFKKCKVDAYAEGHKVGIE